MTALNKNIEKHLRSEAPNVLWYVPRPFKQNMEVMEFLDMAKHAFGNTYYINKK